MDTTTEDNLKIKDKLPEDYGWADIYVIMDTYRWAKGSSIEGAWERMVETHGYGVDAGNVIIKKLPEGSYGAGVTGVGSIEWIWKDGSNRTALAENVSISELYESLSYMVEDKAYELYMCLRNQYSLKPSSRNGISKKMQLLLEQFELEV